MDEVTSSCFPIHYDTTHSGLHLVAAGCYSFRPELCAGSSSRCLVALLQSPVGSAMDRLEALTTAVVEVVAKTYKRKHRDVYDGW